MVKKNLKQMKNEFDEDLQAEMEGASSDEIKKSKLRYLKGIVAGVSRIFFSSKKAVIITIAGMTFLIALITGGVLFLSKPAEKSKDGQDKTAGKENVNTATPRVEEPVFEDIVALKPFERIRLKEGSGMKIISLKLSLELSDGRYKKEVQAMEEKIRQIIAEKLGKMTWLDLRGPEGKIMLKYDLLKQMNSIFPEVMIRNIYFTNFLMQ